MVDRGKVIKGLEECMTASCRGYRPRLLCPYNDEEWDIMRDALALLKEQEWHMLTEDDDGFIFGLPGDDGQYLMTDGKDIWIDDYIDGVDDGVWLYSGRDIREITAWMYMPELPKKNRR